MEKLTGVSLKESSSTMKSLSMLSGNVRSVSWILENNEREAIVVIRHFILANKCSVFVNNAYSGVFRIEQMQTVYEIPWNGDIFRIVIGRQPSDSTLYSYACTYGQISLSPFLSSAYLSPLNNFLSLSIYYEPKCGYYEFHVLEYRWGVHILLKSADDIRQLDRNLQSLYSFSSLRKEFPTLPTLRAPRPGKNESVDGYVVAEDLRQYFQVLLRLDGSAFCADLLSFLEIPVSPRSFQYSPQTSNFSDSSLFLSPV
ncbi:hypothetical protein WA538_002867, partial [Blastocystis sp. DL]